MRMADCHPERLHQALGLCAQCYLKEYDAKRNKKKDPADYAPNFRKPPHPPRRNADCHPEREHWARGLCGRCYNQQRTSSVKATCHPERPHVARGLCARCYAAFKYDQDPEAIRRQSREAQMQMRQRRREELVAAYGGRCACAKCPERNPAFLCLDHVNGDGKGHRMKAGSHTYADLRRRGWPQDGYRLLCWNCNAMTRFGRTCPHEEG